MILLRRSIVVQKNRFATMLAKAYYDADFDWEEHAARVASSVPPFIPMEAVHHKSTSLNNALHSSWNKFHTTHMGKFFKERTYILQAFPELQYLQQLEVISSIKQPKAINSDRTDKETLSLSSPIGSSSSTSGSSTVNSNSISICTVLEIGCGNGSNVFPLLETYPAYTVYGTDISPTALRSLQRHASYERVKPRLVPFLYDIVEGSLPTVIPGLVIPPSSNANTNIAKQTMEKKKKRKVPNNNFKNSVSLYDKSISIVSNTQTSTDTPTIDEPSLSLTGTNTTTTVEPLSLSLLLPSEYEQREIRRQQLNELHQSYCIVPEPIRKGNSLHAILCTFVLSAIHPKDHSVCFTNMYNLLQPNGILCFRDYGLYDIAQLRYHTETENILPGESFASIVSNNDDKDNVKESSARLGSTWYVREGDGTFTYFFTREEISALATAAGFRTLSLRYATVENTNRKKGITLRRVFVHGVFQKLPPP